MAIPLFNKAQKAKITAASLTEVMKETEIANAKQRLLAEYNLLEETANSYQKILKEYDNSLTNNEVMTKTAMQQYINGAITFMDY